MSFTLKMSVQDSQLEFVLEEGESLYIVGANGTGKSAVMHSFFTQHRDLARRMPAHRQNWLSNSPAAASPEQVRTFQSSSVSWDEQTRARHSEEQSEQRVSFAVAALVNAYNVRNSTIGTRIGHRDAPGALEFDLQNPCPVRRLNELFAIAGLRVRFDATEGELKASKYNRELFTIDKMSDGERSALIIAATVLTAPPGSLMLIDEPERHLHRSITAPFLSHLFALRADCAFVISTHEIELPILDKEAAVLTLREAEGAHPESGGWNATLLAAATQIDDELKRDILGARRTIVFIEGTDNSLDLPLFSLLFPDASVIPKGPCTAVEKAVQEINASRNVVWVDAIGIVDRDGLEQTEIERLNAKSIFPIDAYTIESVYYHPTIQSRIALLNVQANEPGREELAEDSCEIRTMLDAAEIATRSALTTASQQLAVNAATISIRRRYFASIPNMNTVAGRAPVHFEIDGAEMERIVAEQVTSVEADIRDLEYAKLITRYPLKRTTARLAIAQALGFGNNRQYEAEVLRAARQDDVAKDRIKSLLADVFRALESRNQEVGNSEVVEDPQPSLG